MKVILTRTNEDYHMEATNESEDQIAIDAAPSLTDQPKGMRPMQLVLCAIASCSAIDVINILKKQRQNPDSLRIEVVGDRDTDKVPAVFTDIHLQFIVAGNTEAAKLQRALDLSFGTYCSVSKMLEARVSIHYGYQLNGEQGPISTRQATTFEK